MNNLFINGATWLRADFHLHTKADKEFKYSDDENQYYKKYIEALKEKDIYIGVITNHNKFDFKEFKGLRRTAQKQNIFLLPGVELSVNDGANGIHTIVIFSEEWLANEQDYINQFLNVAFEGKTPEQYENKNGRSSLNLIKTIKKLEGYQKGFFIVFAHVEQSSGLLNELKGGRIQELGENEFFKKYVLGFQKVRSQDLRNKVKQWFNDWYPAEVEGSDPKSIDKIGEVGSCFLKVSAFTFEAIKFALADHQNRTSVKIPSISHSHIKSVEFVGGVLDGQSIHFSPELNTFIGIRGSGKSSILESLRYAIDISVDVNDSEKDYKKELVKRTLGSGGKIVLNVHDHYGQSCQIQRIWQESANVFYDGKLQPGVSIRETVLQKPLFFGQKELSTAGKGAEKDLIEKLLGTKCNDIRKQIFAQNIQVIEAIERLSKISNVTDAIQEQKAIKKDAEFRLKFYQQYNLEEKLQKQLGFEADVKKVTDGIKLVNEFTADIRDLLAKHEDELRNFSGYTSVSNADFFKNFDSQFSVLIKSLDIIKSELTKTENIHQELMQQSSKLIATRQQLTDEFAAIERNLAGELKAANVQKISPDEFLALKNKLSVAEATLAMLSKGSEQKILLQKILMEELQKLNDLWHQEFQIIQSELNIVSQKNSALKFTVTFKNDKESFLEYFKNIFRGSGVWDTTFQSISEKYLDFIEIYYDLQKAKESFGSNPEKFADWFTKNMKELLVYQTPNKFTILYHGTELSYHSLGQRASALILFVLGQRENDVIIIDQPEDDLDNQTIYEDVIKLLRELKPNSQFIFATHNPNIPVLGDAEQIIACSSNEEKITTESGGLDDPKQQSRIVKIMEGGKEAFEKRKEIYQIWKPWKP